MAEDSDVNRLRWRCRRGMRELDVLLQGFLEGLAATGAVAELATFGRLLEESDMDLYDWLTGRSAPRDAAYADLLSRIARSGHGGPP
jgi:antitoxin CptB